MDERQRTHLLRQLESALQILRSGPQPQHQAMGVTERHRRSARRSLAATIEEIEFESMPEDDLVSLHRLVAGPDGLGPHRFATWLLCAGPLRGVDPH